MAKQADLIIWRLVSVRISPHGESPDLYCLFLEAEHDRPLTRDGRVIFFSDPTRAAEILHRFAPNISDVVVDVDAPTFCFDLPNVLHVLQANAIDEERTVIDTLNLILDFVPIFPLGIRQDRLQVLKDLADHFTFHSDPQAFFAGRRTGDRDVAIETILLCSGVILSIVEFV